MAQPTRMEFFQLCSVDFTLHQFLMLLALIQHKTIHYAVSDCTRGA